MALKRTHFLKNDNVKFGPTWHNFLHGNSTLELIQYLAI